MIAIIQKGYGIYGTGSNVEEAVSDANEWLSAPLNLGRPENNYFLPSLAEADDGEICWADCTDRLAAKVQDYGDVAYEVDGNKIDISEI